MNKKNIGAIAVISGGLLLAFELYCLKFIHLAAQASGLPWNESPMDYLGEPNIIFSILLISAIIISGIVLIFIKEKKGS